MASPEDNIIQDAFRRHEDVVRESAKIIFETTERAASMLSAAVRSGHRIFACGNGGSAADSQHFVAELLCKYKRDREPFPAIALTTDTSALTAIVNDYDFTRVFSRQIEALGLPGDILVAFTTSGKSPNILEAVSAAKIKGLHIIVLTGSKGSGLRDSADIVIIVPSEETARIQEVHELIYHAWCEYIDANQTHEI